MKYREILELYKEGKLSSEEAEKVEQEIEKQEAIEEFRYSRYDDKETMDFAEAESDIEVNKATEEINRRIRKAFTKMGTTVAVCVIVIMVLFQWVLPSATNVFWYNPAKEVNTGTEVTNNQLTADIRAYSELFLTNGRFTYADVEADGFGKYSFVLGENRYRLKEPIVAAGEIKRNKMKLFNPRDLERPYGNAFNWTYYQFQQTKQAYDDTTMKERAKAEDRKEIENLSPYETYYAYISFDNLMSFDEAKTFAEKIAKDEDVWIAVCCGEGAYYNNVVNVGMYDDAFTYNESKLSDEERFIKLIKHMKSSKTFLEMTLGEDIDSVIDTEKALEYIDKNGLQSYGIAFMANKDTLLNVLDDNSVSGIVIQR